MCCIDAKSRTCHVLRVAVMLHRDEQHDVCAFPLMQHRCSQVTCCQRAHDKSLAEHTCSHAQHPMPPVLPQAAAQLLYSTVWQVSTARGLKPAPSTAAAVGGFDLQLRLYPQRELAGPCQLAIAAAAEVLQQLQTWAAAGQHGGRPLRLTVYDAGVVQTSARRVRHREHDDQKALPMLQHMSCTVQQLCTILCRNLYLSTTSCMACSATNLNAVLRIAAENL